MINTEQAAGFLADAATMLAGIAYLVGGLFSISYGLHKLFGFEPDVGTILIALAVFVAFNGALGKAIEFFAKQGESTR